MPMICPYCDSRVKDLPDNHVCPHCGAPLGKNCDTEKKEACKKMQFSEPPLGKYKFSDGYMEIGRTCVRFYRNNPFQRKMDRVIPYNEIADVSFVPGSTLRAGVLCVRGWQDRYTPVSTTFSEAYEDESCAFVAKVSNEEFYRAYLFLKQCADIANAAREEQ